MRKVLGLVGATLLFAGPALAADLAVKAPRALPLAVPTWTGFYIGANAGGTWSDSNSVDIDRTATGNFAPGQPNAAIFADNFAALTTGSFGTGSNGSFIGGGQLGYNWQSGMWVTGIEADIQGLAHQNNGTTTISAALDQFGNTNASAVSVDKSLRYFGTVRGRVGWLATPTLLAYGTGGLAYGGVRTSASIATTTTNVLIDDAFASNSVSDTRAGWTAGGGLEWMFAPNWSAKAEYLYYDLGHVDFNVGTIAPILLPPAVSAGSPLFANSMHATTHFNGNIARVGINYHF
jgi:outer membrane immunogenic protein